MNQVAKGLRKRDPETRKYILKDLTSAKWYLWHGNVFKALELIENLLDNTSVLAEHEKKPCLEAKKLCKMLEEFRTYILNNGAYIPNYEERWRYGEAISTGFVRRWAFIWKQHCRKWLLCQSPRYISTIDVVEPMLTTVCRKGSNIN
jgi:hypothetical protein